MSEVTENFVSLALAGEVTCDEIDDFVDKWHDAPRGLTLHQYLGMSAAEYERWLASPEMLPLILASRKPNDHA